jgi:1-acyl-sn-glycerol-3-phosphate acyltransferase
MGIILAIPVIAFFALVVRKAGYSGWWALLGFVPIVGLVMLWVFAFSRWPVDGRDARSVQRPSRSQPALGVAAHFSELDLAEFQGALRACRPLRV